MLLVDIGNSVIHWSEKHNTSLGEMQVRMHRGGPLHELLDEAWGDMESPVRVLVASVAGEQFEQTLSEWCERRWGITPELVKTQGHILGVANGYQVPEQLGVDRWLALLAARQMRLEPCCIADCGSAVTIDVLDAAAHHQGGFILPGLDMMRESLLHNTAGIVLADADKTDDDFCGRNTGAAIAKGARLATASAIERVGFWAEDHLSGDVQIILTGGDAERIADRMTVPAKIVPDLVLRGLAAIEDLKA